MEAICSPSSAYKVEEVCSPSGYKMEAVMLFITGIEDEGSIFFNFRI
jgi:hypothetical protein